MYTSSGHYDVASGYLDKSLSILQSATQRDRKLQASVYQNLGAVHNQLGEYVKAIVYHEKAIEIYGKMGATFSVAVREEAGTPQQLECQLQWALC